MMKWTSLATLIAAGLILPVAGIFTAAQLQAQTNSIAPETMLAQTDDLPERPGHGGRGDRADRLMEELDLTDEQITQIRAIREGARDQMRTLHDNLRAEHEVMHSLMAGDATEVDLRAQHEKVQTLHREAANQRFETMLATREILTPEQRAELAELVEQRRTERREQRGFRGNRERFPEGDRQ